MDCIFFASLGFFGTPLANNPPNPTGGPVDFGPLESGLAAGPLLFVDEDTFPRDGADLSFVTAFFSLVPF